MEANEQPDVLILGAGAAGLWAAARAAEQGARVRVLEKTERTGTKILASGGSRCNMTTTLGPEDAAKLFGTKGERFLRRAFRSLTPLNVRERFHELGVESSEAPLEKVFPTSGRASDVRDALENWARSAGAEIMFDAHVMSIDQSEGKWFVNLMDGRIESADRLMIAVGGMSYPKSGTTGEGYRWLSNLGLPLVEQVPALVPLTSPAQWAQDMTGISWESADLKAVSKSGKRVAERSRPIVFTHHGLSGPGAMDLSEHVARGEATEIIIDLFPTVEREALRQRLIDGTREHGNKRLVRVMHELVGEGIPKKLSRAVLAQAELEDQTVGQLDKRRRHLLVEALRGLVLPVNGTRGFDFAEVTAGGLPLNKVDPGTMAVRGVDGLFVAGEILDLQGPIGGLNFQAAWATAELAGRAIAQPLSVS